MRPLAELSRASGSIGSDATTQLHTTLLTARLFASFTLVKRLRSSLCSSPSLGVSEDIGDGNGDHGEGKNVADACDPIQKTAADNDDSAGPAPPASNSAEMAINSTRRISLKPAAIVFGAPLRP
ncbi:unnamed protein product [Heligmosomoides polygyrus]|uniref:Uncharacterized protein n=1 Tax=Heligmosomoides polygyrus TaxID=6339 RepID=A0A183FLP6_HELPZ|nr:unnamed protein product [Heligmosomoides polygyrus]